MMVQPTKRRGTIHFIGIGGAGMSGIARVLKDRPIIYLNHRNWLWAYTAKLSGVRNVPDGLLRVQGLKMN